MHPCVADRSRSQSPTLPCNLPLIRTEPILRRIAEERNPGKVLFSHHVTEIKDVGDYVLVTVTDASGLHSIYRCRYAVGADGGKTLGPRIGVIMEGIDHLDDKVSVHFKADLSKYWDGESLRFLPASLALRRRWLTGSVDT